jgi:hypothetical protein
MNYPCPCCRYLTLPSPPPGTFEICPVCWWEDDNTQFADPDFAGGANTVSLRRAQETFKSMGAITEGALRFVRPPTADEIPRGNN